MAMCNFAKSNPNFSRYSTRTSGQYHNNYNDYNFNNNNLPESSTSSCTELHIDRCCTAAKCGTHCSSCCCNVINDHTYCMLKRLCRKIIKDYSRQQCREKYTVFDGGNSVNVRIHRSSSMGQALSEGKLGRASGSERGSGAVTDRQRRSAGQKSQGGKNSGRGRQSQSELDSGKGGAGGAGGKSSRKGKGGQQQDKDAVRDGSARGRANRAGGADRDYGADDAAAGKAKARKRGASDQAEENIDGSNKAGGGGGGGGRGGGADAGGGAGAGGKGKRAAADNGDDPSAAGAAGGKKGRSSKSDKHGQKGAADNGDDGGGGGAGRKSKTGKRGSKGSKSAHNIDDMDEAETSAAARAKAKSKGRTSNNELPVISDLRAKVRKGEDVAAIKGVYSDDLTNLKKSRTRSSLTTGKSRDKPRRVKSMTASGRGRRTSKRGGSKAARASAYCDSAAYGNLSRPSRYDQAGISDMLRAKMEQREICCQPICPYDPCRPCMPCAPCAPCAPCGPSAGYCMNPCSNYIC